MSGAWINPGIVISSPFLAGTQIFHVRRQQEVVGNNGRASVTVTWLRNVRGIISTSGGNSIVREASFEAQGKGLAIATRTRLYGVAQDRQAQVYQPDRIMWRGDWFQVVSLSDGTNIGAGYVIATCQSIDYVDRGPMT